MISREQHDENLKIIQEAHSDALKIVELFNEDRFYFKDLRPSERDQIRVWRRNLPKHGLDAINNEFAEGFLSIIESLARNNLSNNSLQKYLLIEASRRGIVRLTSALLDAGADLGMTDKEGFSALQRAIENRRDKIVFLLEKTAQQQSQEKEGTRPAKKIKL